MSIFDILLSYIYNKSMTETNNSLVQMLLDDRISGKTYLEIEKKHGIPAIEARNMVTEALSQVASKDPVEQRGILQLRLEKVVEHLWQGLEMGSFKHGEVILKAAERIAELMDLNEQTIKHEVTVITDAEAQIVFDVLRKNNEYLLARVRELELSSESRKQLEEWAQWEAIAATEAVEEVIYSAELIEE